MADFEFLSFEEANDYAKNKKIARPELRPVVQRSACGNRFTVSFDGESTSENSRLQDEGSSKKYSENNKNDIIRNSATNISITNIDGMTVADFSILAKNSFHGYEKIH